MLIIGKAITCTLVKEESQETMLIEPQCFKLNNTKYNKSIISFTGLFIIGVVCYIFFGINIFVRQGQGWITQFHGSMDLFVHCCIWPVVLPAIYFIRNPKHLKSVLQDHNLM